jgi:AcrR family transcriptional regulator
MGPDLFNNMAFMPRRRRGQQTAPPSTDDARERILAAAERCIERHGIRKTTMDDIASEVGLSRPSVYRYFADRDDLLIELITRHARALLDRTRKSISSAEWPSGSDRRGCSLHGRARPARL